MQTITVSIKSTSTPKIRIPTRLQRYLFLALAIYFVFIGGSNYYNQIFAVRVFHHLLINGVMIVWLLARWRSGLPRTPVNRWIYALVGVWFAAALVGLDPRVSLETVWFLLTHVLIFFVLVDLLQRGHQLWLIEAQFMIGALVVLMALYQLASWYWGLGIFPGTSVGWVQAGGLPPRLPPLVAPMGVTTWLAAYTVPLGFLVGAWAFTSRWRAARIALGALAGALLLVALLTFSRGGLIAFAAGAVALAGLRLLPYWSRLRARWLIAGVGAAALVVAVGLGITVISRDPGRVAGDALRANLWRSAAAVIPDHPILGVGTGMFGRAARAYRDPAYVDDRLSTAHNLYLNTTAELGLVGLVVIIGLISAGALAFWKHRRAAATPARRLRLDVAAAALVGFGVQSLFDTFTLPALVTLPLLLAAYVVTEPRERADAVLLPPPGDRWPLRIALALLVGYAVAFIQFDRAQAAFNTSIREGSLEAAQQAAALDPGLRLYPLQIAYLTAQTSDTATGIAAYQNALALEPTWDKGWMNLGALYLRAGDSAAAMDAFMRAHNINHLNGAILLWARTADAANAAPAGEIHEGYVQGWIGRSFLPLSEFWTQTPLRQVALQRLIDVYPLEWQYRTLIVHDPERAAALVPAAPETAPEWWIAGQGALTEDAARAAEAFTEAIRLDPLNGDYYASRARALVDTNPNAARRDLDMAALLGTRFESPNVTRALLTDDPDERRRLLASAVPPQVIDQNFEGVLYSGRVGAFEPLPEARLPGPGTPVLQPWYDIAADYEAAGQPDDAIRVYEAILRYDAYEVTAYHALERLGARQ